MAVNPNEDTEFNDALRKHGILPPRPKTPEEPSPPPSPSLSEQLDELDLDELKDKEEDANNSDSERLIASYRRRKLAELRQEQSKARFGRIYPIGRDDYTREVTEASKEDGDGDLIKGTGVVCFLYKDGQVPSMRLFDHLRTLSTRYPRTKFVSIVGDKCIPNCPDRNLPMMILYRSGLVVENLVAWGANPRQPGTLEDVELVLQKLQIVVGPPTLPQPTRPKDESDGEDDDAPRSKKISSAKKAKVEDDSDSDFDL
ncbi:thioredoxin-like protein [Sistotremastrum suecicum HHB10207 ss-3]|uniref:Thioredoxin-like protein n=1 Tax=Sistotremastrum suecicum HHB10207 ss-3 TaxID=1314776 RepID=A0A166IZB6_9AGAM|nr:thioredoxin-like protein [Sistotremastrum suecicum HHB10207 ss-3]